jgi:hypothetical protein
MEYSCPTVIIIFIEGFDYQYNKSLKVITVRVNCQI